MTEHKRRWGSTLPATALLIICFVALSFTEEIATLSLGVLAFAGTLIAAVAVGLVVRHAHSMWSVPGMGILLLVLFNHGALPELIFSETSSSVIINRWIFSGAASRAIVLASLGVLAFAAGVLLSGPDRAIQTATRLRPQSDGTRYISMVGAVLLLVGSGSWVLFAARAGIGPGSSYGEYLAKRDQANLQLIYYIIGVGCVMVATHRPGWLGRMAYASLAIFGLIAFPVGLRGELLFPAAAAAAVLACRRQMPSVRWVLLAGTVLLVLTAGVSQIRQSGFNSYQGQLSISPLAGLDELGSSLYPLAVTVQWHEIAGEPYARGATYWVAAQDTTVRILLRASPAADHAGVNLAGQISQRVGNIGGSLLAEANHNFGRVGTILVACLWGAGLARIDRMKNKGPYAYAASGLALFAFLLLIRNDFSSLPVILLLSAGSLSAAHVLKLLSARSNAHV